MKNRSRVRRCLLAMAATLFVAQCVLAGVLEGPVSDWSRARTLNGVYGEMCGGVEGTCVLKCGKANKNGFAKVSLKISPFSGKKSSYAAKNVYVGDGGDVTVNWDNKYEVTIYSDDTFIGEPYYGGGWRPACMVDAVWSADIGGNLPDGMHWFSVGWYYDEDDAVEDLMYIFESGIYCLNTELMMPFYPEQSFTVSGSKWDFGKAPALKYKKYSNWDYGLIGLYDWSKPNIPATKITYNPRTGIFKGSFKFYTDPVVCSPGPYRKTALKKYTIKVQGIVVDGHGTGTATSTRPHASWPVEIY